MNVDPLDVGIVIGYLSVVSLVAVVVGRKQTFDGFWVNARRTPFVLLLFSVVSTQVGAGVMVGIASATYDTGIGFGLVVTFSAVAGFVAVGLLAPRIKRFGDAFQAVTMAEFFRVRYGRTTEIFAGAIIMFAYLSILGAQLTATGALFSVWTGTGFQAALIFASVSMLLYTAFSGMRGDLYTDFAHFGIMALVFFFVLLPISYVKTQPLSTTFSGIPSSHFSPLTFGGLGFLVGGILFGAFIVVLSMELWQRIYAARGGAEARGVFLWSALLMLPFYLLAIAAGFIAKAQLPALAKPDLALFEVIGKFVPHGMLGLLLAALLATFISSANSLILVMSATLVRNFVHSEPNSDSGGRHLLLSRAITFGVGAVALLVALALPDIVQLLLNAYFVLALLIAPIVGGLFWKRSTARAANISIIFGLVTTVALLPFLPRQAFLGGAVPAMLVFVIATLATRHSASEKRV